MNDFLFLSVFTNINSIYINQIYQVIIVKPELLIEAFMEIDKLKPVAPKPLLWGAKVLLERD